MSPQNFNSQKKSGTAEKAAYRLAVSAGANPDWIKTGQGEMRLNPAPAQRDASEWATLRDIVDLQRELIKLGTEIGKIRDKMGEAAETGDIRRLGLVGGKGK